MKTFKIIYTSDIHGKLFACPNTSSLEIMGKSFKRDGNTLIFDGGDILQGGTTGEFVASHDLSPNPFALLLNESHYDAMTLGNHDTNFGVEYLERFLNDFNGICLCANLKDRKSRLPIYDTHVFTLENGLRIGVFGITSPYISYWEAPSIAGSLIITPAFEAAKRCLGALNGACDVTVCIYHGGFEDKQVDTGQENEAFKLCSIPGLDLLLTAHHHQSINRVVGDVLAVQAGCHARSFAEIQGCVADSGKVRLNAKIHGVPLSPSGSSHKESQSLRFWEMESLGFLPSEIPSVDSIQAALHGSPLAGFINDILIKASGAQLSMIHISSGSNGLPACVRVKDVFENCYNANCLCTIEVTGEIIRKVLEWSACSFTVRAGKVCPDDEFLEGIRHLHHFQFISGIDYSFDFALPRGQRLTGLKYNGNVVKPDDRFTMCLSSYHRYGGDGFAFFKDCPLISVCPSPIYSLIIQAIRNGSA